MVTKNQTKLIQKLQQKKYRQHYQMFVVEGKKSIIEFLQQGFISEYIFVTDWFSDLLLKDRTVLTTKDVLRQLSFLKNPDEGIAVFKIPENQPLTYQGLIVALDDVRDPGNLGTIIRLCDWFGISQLVCSEQTVDCYNPKVVQATMGSLGRVSVHYTELQAFLQETSLPVFATAMNGKNVYQTTLPEQAVLVMGNEANGISERIFSLADEIIGIPKFGEFQKIESLNVATASAILLSEFRRIH